MTQQEKGDWVNVRWHWSTFFLPFTLLHYNVFNIITNEFLKLLNTDVSFMDLSAVTKDASAPPLLTAASIL